MVSMSEKTMQENEEGSEKVQSDLCTFHAQTRER